jgi:hypothetical protein
MNQRGSGECAVVVTLRKNENLNKYKECFTAVRNMMDVSTCEKDRQT